MDGYVKSAEFEYPKLTKKLLELDEIVYKKCVLLIRIRELQSKSMRIKKIYEPTGNGTRIIFERVEDEKDYLQEVRNITKDQAILRMTVGELKEVEW